MIPEEKIEVITDFLNHFMNKLDREIIGALERNLNKGKELLQDYEEEGIKAMLYTKEFLQEWLIDDEILYDYVNEED
ncbi:hypothetical protein [Terrisporobacter sp.]|uniref:hypothetical protein n=1 Tax=Terrisporobacter sp. TaxID=1965305 RepID=UPI00289F068E|nr:hypothetical protein [Terrisporobacter sp.]